GLRPRPRPSGARLPPTARLRRGPRLPRRRPSWAARRGQQHRLAGSSRHRRGRHLRRAGRDGRAGRTDCEVRAMSRVEDMGAWLADLREYLDQHADAEYLADIPHPVPNDAMRLLVELDRLFPALEGALWEDK